MLVRGHKNEDNGVYGGKRRRTGLGGEGREDPGPLYKRSDKI